MGCLLALSDRTRGAALDQGRVSEQISLPFQSRRRNTHIHTQFWCLCDWNTLSQTREEMYSSSIFSLVKRIVQVLPARIVWKPVGLSRRDSVTKARWIRAAAFAPEPAPDKQSQHAAARAWEPKKQRSVCTSAAICGNIERRRVERLQKSALKPLSSHLSAGCQDFSFSWRLISTKTAMEDSIRNLYV